MGLSTSTVNGYRVRIRGKLVQLDRTEIVAKMVHLGYKNTHSRARRDLDAERGSAWHLLALHFVPSAVPVAKYPGVVAYANLEAERLYHVDPGGRGRERAGTVGPERLDYAQGVLRSMFE